MELIQRTTLIFQEGRSDKVYEVDLCQTGSDRYVVNFRYGRRGGKLKEGVKTERDVPLAQAQRVFEQLVNSKISSGYRDVTTTGIANLPERQPSPPPTPEEAADRRKQVILNRLQGSLNQVLNRLAGKTKEWPLERVIWRAGELKIVAATPALLQLLGSKDGLRDYCIVWALGWCGNQETIPTLIRLYQNAATPEFVRRIALEAVFKLADTATKAELQTAIIELLPPTLQALARNGTAEDFTKELKTILANGTAEDFTILDRIYQIDGDRLRPALLEILRTAPLQPNYFKPLRHIFKMAEYRQDAEVFGILAYRLEKEKGNFDSNRSYIYLPGGGYVRRLDYKYNRVSRTYDVTKNPEFEREMTSANARLAYSQQTRDYLRRRVWRSLRQLGADGEVGYINFAVGILQQYTDNDAQPPRETTLTRWNHTNWTRIETKHHWDSYASYLNFNHILYENSPRYTLKLNSKAWRCQENYKPGDPEPRVREEAFPQLWQQHPQALLKLLLESKCRPVHHFAVKALRSCSQFGAEINLEQLIQLINQPYEVTVELAFELVRERYNPTHPNFELVIALANCAYQPGRSQAYQWIEAQREPFLSASNLIAALVASPYSDTRTFARRLLSSSIISDATARILIGRLIAEVLTFETNQAEIAKEIGETLLLSFALQLRTIGLGVVLDLLQHPLVEVQELGARILLNHETPAAELPAGLIDSLLNSAYEIIRGIGVRLFGQLPDSTISQQYDLLLSMATHELADMRNAIRPVIRRLASGNSTFVSQLLPELISILLKKEPHEGIHNSLVNLLKTDIPGWMAEINRETAMKLLQARSAVGQELGGLVLTANSDRWTTTFPITDIVKLASHEILTIREAARQMFAQSLDRIRANATELLAAVRLLEAKWEDSREFARQIFANDFNSTEFSPQILISICDSGLEDVRQFGRDLVTRNFQHASGQDYLLKFSEHPAADMQLFATNYLETYAADSPTRLRELCPYFISVLCRVNKGRVAKQRVLAFLTNEAQKSLDAAQIVAEILTRQSLTIAIGDKAQAIQTMLKIQQKYPQISVPIQVKAVVEVRT